MALFLILNLCKDLLEFETIVIHLERRERTLCPQPEGLPVMRLHLLGQ
jgi:hypothetical protein